MTPKNLIGILVGRRIRSLREMRGWSQWELATRLGLPRDHRSNVSRTEKGRHVMDVKTLGMYARALGVSPADLIAATDVLPVEFWRKIFDGTRKPSSGECALETLRSSGNRVPS